MNVSTRRLLKRVGLSAGAAALGAMSGQAGAALLSLPVNPLFVSNDVAPNVMFMVDSSGSMSNLVADSPYVASTVYLAACPPANRLDPATRVYLSVRTAAEIGKNGPKITQVGSTDRRDWGADTASQRCFDPTATYLAALNASDGVHDSQTVGPDTWWIPRNTGVAAAFAAYTGNYLNWYFDPAAVGAASWDSRQRRKPLPTSAGPTGFVLSRNEIARETGVALVNGLDNRLRVGFSIYDGDNGGKLQIPIRPLDATNATDASVPSTPTGVTQRMLLTTSGTSGIGSLPTGGNTPMAETLSGIGRYFADGTATTGTTGTLTMAPKDPPRTVTRNIAQAFPQALNGTTGDPITQSCQQSFAVLLTDGRPTNDDDSTDLAIGSSPNDVMKDYDGDCYLRSPACLSADKKPDQSYEPSAGSDYLDDVAQALFETDLRPGFPVESRSGTQFKNNVVTHVIGFADNAVQNDPLMTRAAAQGGGTFTAAADANALVTAFNNIITDILQRSSAFASASLNSTSVSNETRLFQAGFNSSLWNGTLRAIPISNGATGECPGVDRGQLCPSGGWEASSLVPAPSARTVLTFKPSTKDGIPFLWDSLDDSQKVLLRRNPDASTVDDGEAIGMSRLAFTRGDRTTEQSNGGPFRNRGSRLGDIVDSSPVFVGAPNSALPFPGYSSFRNARAGREPMVYVGGNDGMLHGFNAETGVEQLAYIPSRMFGTDAKPRLSQLTARPHTHVFGVNGSPSVGDIQTGGGWASYLVGGLAAGGQGLYALNITDPSDFTESPADATQVVAWEFTDSNSGAEGRDLGYTYSQPAIVKMKNGKWAAIIGNGYNSKELDGNASSTGQAALFIIYMDGPGSGGAWAKGTHYEKIVVGPTGGDNGLATPAPVDIDGDSVVDYIFAGDLNGAMWQFNVNDGNASNWRAAYGGINGTPLFTATNHNNTPLPITAPPEVGLNLSTADPDDLVVYFGTGKYLANGDNKQTGELTQAFFGIFANPIASPAPSLTETSTSPLINPGRGELLEQFVREEFTAPNGQEGRKTTRNELTSSHKGWFIDLYNTEGGLSDADASAGANKGERQISRPILRGTRIVFTTLIPSENPCDFGGSGWLMELESRDGGGPRRPALDVNDDLIVDLEDAYDSNDDDVVDEEDGGISGLRSDAMLSAPAVLSISPTQEAKYLVRNRESTEGSGDFVQVTGEAAAGRAGRLTWRELQP